MSDVVKYRADGTVEWFAKSIHELPFIDQPNVLIGSLTFPAIPVKYWKVDAGVLREMTPEEKSVVDAAEQTALNIRERDRINSGQIHASELLSALSALGVISLTTVLEKIKKLKGL